MKKIFLYTAAALATVCLAASCDDILDQKPTTSFSDASVWSDLALSKTYLNAQYQDIYSELQKDSRFSNFTIEVLQQWAYGTTNVTNSLISPDSPGLAASWDVTMGNPWKYHYKCINKINLFLENIDNVPGDDTERNLQKGQGLFLRAWNYHMLYAYYGRVPIVTHTYALDSEFKESRADMDAVADFIVKDLDDAASLLPVSWSGKDFGRITKGAALALKARVLMLKASPLYDEAGKGKDQSRWQAAAAACKAVIDLGGYSFKEAKTSDEYSALFFDPQNPEAIFEKLFDPNYGAGSKMAWWHQAPCGIGDGFQGWGTYDPSQNIVDYFEMADGTKAVKVDTVHLEAGKTPWEGRDIRMYSDILFDGDLWGYGQDEREVEVFLKGDENTVSGKDSPEGAYYWNASKTGYHMRKFLNRAYDMNGTVEDETPWFFIRYAEIVLDYAECQIELGNYSEALNYINMTRTRCGMPAYTDASSYDAVWAEYDYERRIELLFEGQRWFDMRRWKKLQDEYNNETLWGCVVTKYSDGSKGYNLHNFVATRRFPDEKYYWLPVPREELNRSSLIDGKPYEN